MIWILVILLVVAFLAGVIKAEKRKKPKITIAWLNFLMSMKKPEIAKSVKDIKLYEDLPANLSL